MVKTLNEWRQETKGKKGDTEFTQKTQKIVEAESLNQTLIIANNLNSLKTHSQAIYTSRLLDVKNNLLQPQNSQAVNDYFHSPEGNFLRKTVKLTSKKITEENKLLEKAEKEPKGSKRTLEIINYFVERAKETKELTKELEKIIAANPNIREEVKKTLKKKTELKSFICIDMMT